MKKQILYLLALGFIFILGCQKEESFELPSTPAGGSLQDDASGDCLPKTVNGVYAVGQALVPTTNTMTVAVSVTKTGTYTVYTDTVNGYFFRTTGTFTTLGTTNVTLHGNGTPIALGTNNFVVTFDTTFCDIQVTVTSPAVFTLAGAPNACTTPVIAGDYGKDVPLTAANTVILNVNVTTAGNYNVTTTAVNGMTFSGSGNLAVGAQTILLTGSGTPTTAGANTIPLSVGTSICSFTITVAAPGVGTLGGAGGACTPSTVNGIYTAGTPLDASNTVSIQVNVTTAGAFTITTNTVGGMSFSFNGNLALGTQTVNLLGTGTPAGTGAQNFTVTLGAGTCTFSIPLAGPGVGTLGGAGGTCTPSLVNGTYQAGTALGGSNSVDVQVNVTTAGAFNITTNTVNGYSFSFTGNLALGTQTVTLVGAGTPSAAGSNVFTVTVPGAPASTCTFTVTVVAAPPMDYFPRTTNSNWSYEWDDLADDSLQINVIANTHSAIGNTYNIFMETVDISGGFDSSGYYRKAGNDYFQWIDLADYGLDNPLWTELNFLKDNQTVGFTWTSNGYTGTVLGTPITIRIRYTITQQDGSTTVVSSTGSTPYNNTIIVKEEIEQFVGGIWVSMTSTVGRNENYYSRGVGLIQQYYYDGTGALDTKFEMRRSQVF